MSQVSTGIGVLLADQPSRYSSRSLEPTQPGHPRGCVVAMSTGDGFRHAPLGKKRIVLRSSGPQYQDWYRLSPVSVVC